ncbi:Erythrocyte membrane protein 1, variant 2 [Balamuthia mandrillaris]
MVRALLSTSPCLLSAKDQLGNTALHYAVTAEVAGEEGEEEEEEEEEEGEAEEEKEKEGSSGGPEEKTKEQRRRRKKRAKGPYLAYLLVEHGADLYVENRKGWTPLDLASARLRKVILEAAQSYREQKQTSAEQTTVEEDGMEGGRPGKISQFVIRAKNGFARPQSKGGDTFRVRVTVDDPRSLSSSQREEELEMCKATVEDGNDGTYLVSYRPLIPGIHRIHVALDVAGTSPSQPTQQVPISGSPFVTFVSAEYEDLINVLIDSWRQNKELEQRLAEGSSKLEIARKDREQLHEERKTLQQQLEDAKNKAYSAVKLAKEQYQKVEQLQRAIDAKGDGQRRFELTAGSASSSDVLKQDWLVKRGTKVQNWKKRYAILFGTGQLEYFESKGSLDLKQAVQVREVEQSSISGGGGVSKRDLLAAAAASSSLTSSSFAKVIAIDLPGRQYLLRMITEEAHNGWLYTLQQIISTRKRRNNNNEEQQQKTGS